MPRKVNYGPDYDDGYDDYDYDYGYDDYDYDADVGGNEAVKPLKAEKDISKLPVWRCSICTYENDKKLTYCEICGVIPVSSVKNKNKNLGKGESTMAQSIFAPVLSKTPKSSTPLQEIKKENKGPSQAFMTLPIVDDDATCFQASTVKTEIITSNLQKPNKDEGYGDQRRPVSFIKDRTSYEYNPEKWMLEQENGIPKQLNLAIVGHVDSGKSTLSGRMLHLLGYVSQKEMHKYQKEAKEKGKASFSYAWVMDECGEERERGVTMTVGVAYFDTKNYHVVLLDSPGHKDFVPNMISGATQADAAVLVVDASMGSFEAGMNGYGIGQTREHAQLIRSFGVECIVVLVNKMDVVGYSKERFDYIKAELGTFLSSLQFKGSCVFSIRGANVMYQRIISQVDPPLIYDVFLLEKTFKTTFSLLVLHMWLVLRRLKEDGKEGVELGQYLYEIYNHDVELRVSKAGVNLLLIKWMKELEKIFYGNIVAYDGAMRPDSKSDQLVEVVWRNIFSEDGSDTLNSAASVPVNALSRYTRRESTCLSLTDKESIFSGNFIFTSLEK